MSSPVVLLNLKEAIEKGQSVAGSMAGKIVGSIAGILLIVTVFKATFYMVKVGQRGVLMRSGMPVLKQNGKLLHSLAVTVLLLRIQRWQGYSAAVEWLYEQIMWWAWARKRQQTGLYKIKRPGIRMMFPGFYHVEKVNVQRRVQKITPFDVDAPDGQYHIMADMVTRVPCDDDGPDYADYPARSIIKSSEADDVFESWAGTTLLSVLESCSKEVRQDRQQLFELVNSEIAHEFDEVGYLLEGINLRNRSLTPIQKAINGFSPEQPSEGHVGEEPDNVVQLPHPIVMTTALPDVAHNS